MSILFEVFIYDWFFSISRYLQKIQKCHAIFRIKKIAITRMHLTSCIALLLATSYTIQLTDHHACMHANLNITLLKINRNSQLIVYN
jgi:hypothetical protein